MKDAPAPSPADVIDIDLYCLFCGYNLRGLSGDPRRCPECGEWNRVGDLEVPAREIKQQLTLMETAPATCVLMLVIFVVCSSLFATNWSSLIVTSRGSRQWATILVGFDLGSLAIWFWHMHVFRRSCRHDPAWSGLFLRYHFLGALAVFCVVVPIISLPYIRSEIMFPAVLLWVAFAFWATRQFIHKPLRSEMDVLQRAVAVEIARNRLRRGVY